MEEYIHTLAADICDVEQRGKKRSNTLGKKHSISYYVNVTEMVLRPALHLSILCQQVFVADHAACQNTH